MDDIFEVLADVQRRRILVEMLDQNVRADGGAYRLHEAIGSTDRQSKIELYHSHLPQLEGAGYIEWERETGDVEPGPQFDEIRPVLELLDDHTDSLPGQWV